jgi:hypothetical protein
LPETEELFSPPTDIRLVRHAVVLWGRGGLGDASRLQHIVRNGGQNFVGITFRSKKFRQQAAQTEVGWFANRFRITDLTAD